MRTRPAGVKNKTAVQVSQSGLESFFQCPAKFRYMTECEPTAINQVLKIGIETHAILAGQMEKGQGEFAFESDQYADTLRQIAEDNGILVDHHEVTQMIEIEEGIHLKRIIDGIGTWEYATDEFLPVLVDWKTSEKGDWPSFRGGKGWVAPKAWGFQAVSYLIPPGDDELERLNLKAWPKTILFVVGNMRGRGVVIPYSVGMDPEGEENFHEACRLFRWSVNTHTYPKIRGYACGLPDTKFSCPFISACYRIGKWKDDYTWEEADDSDRN
jgi:hypothetical protein